jgi:hypothetical protein
LHFLAGVFASSRARTLLALSLSLLALFVATAARADKETKDLADPIPLRRLLLAPERLPAEMKRMGEGVLVRLGRTDFESLVRKAATAQAEKKTPPRLVEARYRARLDDMAALGGTAEWKVLHPGTRPALLRLQSDDQPFNLAVKQPRYENRDALLTEFPDPDAASGRSLALLVDRPGQHTVLLEWSARAEHRPEGLQVDLRLPLCPVALLELNLPADRALSALDGTPVLGPSDAGAADRRLWKVAAGGKAHLPLLIRHPGRAETVLLARQKTVQKLSPDGVESLTTFHIEALHQEVRELICECDSVLRPIEVLAPALENWTVSGNRVVIRLERPLREGVVEVRSLAPLGDGRPGAPAGRGADGLGPARLIHWTSPAVRLERALPRGETLELWLHPDLRVTSWQPGDFRLADAGPLVDPETKVRLRRLVLHGGALAPSGKVKPAAAAPRRPAATLQAGAVALRAVQQSWWRIADGMSLTVQVHYQVRQGMLFQLPLRLPAGWEVETVEMVPAGLLRTSSVKNSKQGPLLLVELRSPLSAGKTGEGALTLRLQPARDPSGARPVVGRDLPFPDVVPLGATYREGGLAIDYDDQVYIAQVAADGVAGETAAEGPWGKSAPGLYYPFKGEALTGTLRLRPRAPRFRARVQTEVLVAGDRPAVQTRLVLEGEGGTTSQVDVHLSAGSAPAQWHVEPAAGPGSNRLRRVERLHHPTVAADLAALAAVSPLHLLALQAARPQGSFWRLTLARPLGQRQPLVLRTTLAPVPAPGALGDSPVWVVPLAGVPAASRSDGEVTIHLAGARLVSLLSSGLREAPASRSPSGPPRAASAWRSFRYSDATAALSLRTRSVRADSATTTVDRARLTTVLTGEGTVRHHFRFRLLRWPQRTLPVRLPAGARLCAAAVNGHWLEQLAATADETIDLPVPVTAAGDNGELNHPSFELLYTSAGPRTSDPWPRLHAPRPVLPVTPAAFTRRWLLPPGVLPLWDHDVQRLPGSEESRSDTFLLARRPTDLFRLGPALPLPGEPAQRLLARQQALTDAAAGLRARIARADSAEGRKIALARPADGLGRPKPEMRLDALVEEVAFAYLGEMHPLVLDASALSRAGVGPRTPVPVRPASAADDRTLPWEALGLVALPARAGVLLTSRAAAQRWSDDVPESIEQAMAAAAVAGRDPSGRFLAALEWLQPVRNRPAAGAPLFPEGDSLEGWTAWAPVAGTSEDTDLRIVRRGAVAGLGLALAGVLALALLRAGKGAGGRRLRFVLLWLGVAGVALAWLPASLRDLAWWPLLAGLTIALPWYLAWANRTRRSPTPAASSPKGSAVAPAAVTAGLLLVLLAQSPGPAQAPPSTRQVDPGPLAEPVYLLRPTEDQPESVLVAPGLIARLEKMARSGLAPTSGAVLVSASYEGKLVNGIAEFDAVFHAHTLGDAPSTLTLPLGGIQILGDVLLDGARVPPLALPGARTGYTLPVRSAGRHKVELRFRVAAGSAGQTPGIRQVRFSVPPLVQSRLVFHVGPGSTHLQALVKHGAQRVVPDAGGQRLEVELGAVSAPVHLRWYQEAKPPRSPRVEFQEAYLWDLRPDASSLTALVRYHISGGAVTRLHLDLPASLELRSAQARRPAQSGSSRARPEDAAPDSGVRLSDWTVLGAPSSRVANLDFPGPVAGVVEVTLELVPRSPWAGAVLLPIPRPHGQPMAQALAYLAYRTQGLEDVRTNFLRLTGISNDKFAPFWPAASRPAASSLAYASTFRREQGQGPELRLQLRPLTPRLQAVQEIKLLVGPRQAEVKAHIELTAPNRDLSVVEWEFSPGKGLVVAEVRGADVGRWCQSGTRLLVWLEKTTGSTEIDVSGFLPLTALPGKKKPGVSGRLDLPCLRIGQARVQTDLTVEAGPGLALLPQGMRGLTARGLPSAVERRYTAREAIYGGSFLVQVGPAPVADVRTEAALRGKELTFTAIIDYRVPGDLRTVGLRLRDWEGDADLEVKPGSTMRRREQFRGATGRRERTWSLDLAPGVRDHYRMVLRGRMPLEEAAEGVPMPDLVVLGAKANHTLVVDGSLATESSSGVTPTPPPAGSASGVQAWRRIGEEWSMRLLPREGARPQTVQVLLVERRASVPDGRRWLHEAVYWLLHEAPAELRVSWPGAVEVVGVAIDDSPVSIVQPESAGLWLPLSGPAGIRHVRIRWRNDGPGESLDRPDLAGPRLAGAIVGPTIWTLTVPPGWEVVSSDGDGERGVGADRRAAVALYRARAQLAISRELLRQPRTDDSALAAAQRRFARSIWVAELALKAGADPRQKLGPGGEHVSDWRAQLRQENRALLHEHQLDEVRQEAERQVQQGGISVNGAQLPAQGTPVSWLADHAGRPRSVQLAQVTHRQVRQALAFSGQWLIVLLLVWAVTLSRVLRSFMRWLWPEQMALLGVLGWQVAGPTLLVLFLLALGLSGRLLLLVRGMQGLLARRPRPAPSGSSLRG